VILDILRLAVGFVLIIKGGDMFVDSSVDMAHRLRVPRMVIGGTLVSLATTTPELIVSATASWMGDSGIAIGNAIGSAIANIGLIVGLSAMMTVIRIDLKEFRGRSLWMVASAVLVILFTIQLQLSRWMGWALMLLALTYLILDYWNMKSESKRPKDESLDISPQSGSMRKSVIFFGFGAVLVIMGSQFLVVSGIGIAHALGIPSVIIGLSVIAIGTSLPELVTAIASARKGVPDLSIGNIVGANVLNLALITGLAGAINPLRITRFTQLYSFPWLIIFISLMIFMFRRNGMLVKKDGLILLALYIIYIAGLIVFPALGVT